MAKWKLHIPTDRNCIYQYRCGLVAGQKVRLKKDLRVATHDGTLTGEVHLAGEEWIVLVGIKTDPVLWFLQPNGERCTWEDDANSVREWFELETKEIGSKP